VTPISRMADGLVGGGMEEPSLRRQFGAIRELIVVRLMCVAAAKLSNEGYFPCYLSQKQGTQYYTAL
jgi:hypothetical protein